MARLQPNMNVFKMTGLAIAFTYFGAFALGDAWGMTTQEIIDKYPISFYLTMAIFVTLLLQGEIQDQKEKLQEQEREEQAVKDALEQQTSQPSPATKKKKKKKKKSK